MYLAMDSVIWLSDSAWRCWISATVRRMTVVSARSVSMRSNLSSMVMAAPTSPSQFRGVGVRQCHRPGQDAETRGYLPASGKWCGCLLYALMLTHTTLSCELVSGLCVGWPSRAADE